MAKLTKYLNPAPKGSGLVNANRAEWYAWNNARHRCHSEGAAGYRATGALGIKMCEEWLTDFPRFLADMGKRPGPGHVLTRHDKTADYTASNCYWQARTPKTPSPVRKMAEYTLRGVTLRLDQWAAIKNCTTGRLAAWTKKSMTFEEAFDTPKSTRGRPAKYTITYREPRKRGGNPTKLWPPITAHGVTKSMQEWSELNGVSMRLIMLRLRKGDTPVQAIRPVYWRRDRVWPMPGGDQ